MEETRQGPHESPNEPGDQKEGLPPRLREAFAALPNPIEIHLFLDKNAEDPYLYEGRDVVRIFEKLSPQITLKEHETDGDHAGAFGADRSPTLIFQPDNYSVKWLGLPLGEEARTFVEALLLMGFRTSALGDESRRILEGIDSPRDVKVFVSSTCPYCPQQAVNAVKAAIERPDMIRLEIVDIQMHPDLADQYEARSVPLTFANGVLVGKGAQPEELFVSSLEALEEKTVYIPTNDASEVEADLVIVGGGPAGLTAAIYGARSGFRTVVVEKGALGGQVATTPVVENYPGFTQVGGKTLVDILVQHALQYAEIFPGEEVLEIRRGEPFEVTTTKRRFKSRAVLLATGAVHRHLGIPGEERFSGRGVSYCSTCDGPLFQGKKVLIAGGGNSAVTEALHLKNLGVDITLVHRRDALRAQEHLVKNLEHAGIPVLYNSEVRDIRGEAGVEEVVLFNNSTKEFSTLKVEGVFVSIGYEPSVELARKIGLELTENGYIKRDPHHRTSIPGIYSAGDVEGGYKQIVTASGQGAEAALSIFEDLVNPYWRRDTSSLSESARK